MIDIRDGLIVTDLEDDEFIELIWSEWAGYDEGEIEALWESMLDFELSEENLRKKGFTISENVYFVQPRCITLLKVEDGKWIIEGADGLEMEEFVEEIDEEDE